MGLWVMGGADGGLVDGVSIVRGGSDVVFNRTG